jgi:ribosomal-protein-alanine N-acetyltransferase
VELLIDSVNLIAELAYGIALQHRGKGLTTEAARAVISYGFLTCGLAKIWARVDVRNVASIRVIEKCGMQREDLLRKHVIRHGERVDWVY